MSSNSAGYTTVPRVFLSPSFGFARIRCPRCRAEHLLTFSCKTRGFCPACHAKRLEEWGGYAGLAKKDGISRPDQPELLINPQSCPKDQNCIKIPAGLAQFCSWREE